MNKTFQINDMVRLNQHALDRFYAQDEHVAFHIVGGMETIDDVGIVNALKTEEFVDYVSDIISFKDGKNAGLIESFYDEETKNDACIVKYFCMIDLKWKRCRHKIENLDKVSIEVTAIEN